MLRFQPQFFCGMTTLIHSIFGLLKVRKEPEAALIKLSTGRSRYQGPFRLLCLRPQKFRFPATETGSSSPLGGLSPCPPSESK
jgi:hypothetical protein